MNNYYFTFGLGHENGDKYQPIVAKNESDARAEMIRVYGIRWSSMYTEKDFKAFMEEGFFQDLAPLEPLYCPTDAMTFGEMLDWTKRFSSIIGGAQCLRDKRLAQLMTDLEGAYQIPFLNDQEWNKRNPFVYGLYRAVSDARSL